MATGRRPRPRPSRFDAFFGTRAVSVWTVVAGIAAVIGVGLAIGSQFFEGDSPKPDSDLRLAALAVAPPTSIDGTVRGPGKDMKSKLETSAVDITLRNDGTLPALITEAKVRIKYGAQLEDCSRSGGGATISANYDIVIASGTKNFPASYKQAMRFTVRPKSVDRLTLSIGPRDQDLSSWDPMLYEASIELVDDQKRRLEVGDVAFTSRPGTLASNAEFSSPHDLECIRHNAAIYANISRTSESRSDELNKFIRLYAQYLKPRKDAQPICLPVQEDAVFTRLCGAYTQRTLRLSIKLPSDLERTNLQIVTTLTSSNSRTRYQSTAHHDGTTWGGGCELIIDEGDDPSEDGCINPADFDTERALAAQEREDVLVENIALPIDFPYQEIWVSVQAQRTEGGYSDPIADIGEPTPPLGIKRAV